MRPVEPLVAGLERLFQPWHAPGRLAGDRQPCLSECPLLPDPAPQDVDARHHPFPRGSGVRQTRRASASSSSPWRAAVCLRRSQSESRMPEIGTSGLMSGEGKRNRHNRKTAPFLDSTHQPISTTCATAPRQRVSPPTERRVVGNRQGETEKTDDRANQALGLTQSQPEYGPQRRNLRIASDEYHACPPRLVRGAACQAATASSLNHTVRLPRWRRLASYAVQFVTLRFCFGMQWRRAASDLNGMSASRIK